MKIVIQTSLRTLQPVLAACISLGLSMCSPVSASAQGADTSTPGPAAVHSDTSIPTPLKLHFDSPVTFPVGTKQSAIFGDFKCGTDGSIFLPISENVSQSVPPGGVLNVAPSMRIVALAPSGDVVRFTSQDIPGYRVSSSLRYFVSHSHVYALELADKLDPADPQKTIGRSHLIQVFGRKGELTQSIFLEPDVHPVNIAAFESGEILVFSVDELNKTTRPLLFDSAGRPESELKLFDSDFGSQLNSVAKGENGFYSSHDAEALSRLLALASLAPHGENLLLATSQANLPVLELNQHGLVRATTLALPPGATLGSLLPSDDGLLHAVVGEFRSIPTSSSTPESSAGGVRGFFYTEVDEFYPQDGSLLRRISLPSPAPAPVCAIDGTYMFFAPREEDGKLQLIRATPVH